MIVRDCREIKFTHCLKIWLTLLKSTSTTDMFLRYLENFKTLNALKYYQNIFICYDRKHSLSTFLTTEGRELQENVKKKKLI